MTPDDFLTKKEDLLSIINNESANDIDRVEALMDLGFLYGKDYNNAYKCFRLAKHMLERY